MKECAFYSFIIWLLTHGSHVNCIRNSYIFNSKIQHGNLPDQSEVSESWIATPWINDEFKLGQVSGVSVDPNDNVYLFHRVDRVWDLNTFTVENRYTGAENSPIKEPTILIFNSEGKLLNNLGQNMFYLPHGITVDKDFNIWVTDVALHQVMKLSPNSSKILLQLGEKFIPGSDPKHFCKPTSVAVIPNGDFFVADGYCNSRIMKFNSEGNMILQWGRNTIGFQKPGNNELKIPHALTVVEEEGLLCTADRENGRILCYKIEDGSYSTELSSPYMGTRLFSVAYSSISGGRFFIVNGQSLSQLIPVQGFVMNIEGKLIGSFGTGLKTPHDIATSSNGTTLYVVEIGPNKAWKFVYNKPNIPDSQNKGKSQVLSQEHKSTEVNKDSDDTEGLAGAIFVTIACFMFAFGIFVAIIFYSKSRKSGNSDTKRLLSNLDY